MGTFSGLITALVKSDPWKEPEHVRIVFLTMVGFQDWDYVYKGSVFELCEQSGKDELAVLDYLE